MFKLSNNVYDKLKALVTVVSPAAITLYATLGTIYEWTNVVNVTGTIAAVTVFVGVITGVSARSWDEPDTTQDDPYLSGPTP